MFGIGTSELIVLIVIAIVCARRHRAPLRAFTSGLLACIESLALSIWDLDMSKFWKKFLWTPQFWALLGFLGCATGLYFQRVANNGSGLWCLGLIFLGAAYVERKDIF
jgi:hypothetical protein